MMSFTQFAQEKDVASFKTAFQDAIQSAVSDELEQEKLAVAQAMFGVQEESEEEMSDEELDQYLDSLSEEELEALAEEVGRVDEVSPPGREKQVKALKKVPGVKNPWAVSWASYNKGKK